jgi:hypothetical protein
MKNLLVYISPTKSFNNPLTRPNNAASLVKVQIEQSIKMGWNKADIVLATNFPYKYGDIKAVTLDNVDIAKKPSLTKLNALVRLFEAGHIKKNELYWYHDLDAFQLTPIARSEIRIRDNEIALTDAGGQKYLFSGDKWNSGIIYFRLGAADIFRQMQQVALKKNIDPEMALSYMTKDLAFKKRVKELNNSYNLTSYNLDKVYQNSIKPIKVAHFDPTKSLSLFMGRNKLNKQILPNDLVKLFKFHRIG